MATTCWAVWLFWLSLTAVIYPYAIYPLLLAAWNRLAGRRLPEPDPAYRPRVTIICPVHNEAGRIVDKIRNLLALDYPPDKMQILVVGDGCTDQTLELALLEGEGRVEVIPQAQRAGKAAALNAGLVRAHGDVVIFTDAGIRCGPGTISALAGHFGDPSIGCVSGEDQVDSGGGEGLYGRLEMLLRREEAKLHSIAGASGCLYAQRRSLCRPFRPAMAPDFLSVLDTVRAGCRAVSEPAAIARISATPSQRDEFARKTRTFLRGITALFANPALLNPFCHPAFSFILVSHKLLRWLAPLALVGCLVSALLLQEWLFYRSALRVQFALYAFAVAGLLMPGLAARSAIVRICAYFLLVNAAAARAFALWLAGARQEVWAPTRRPA